MIANILWIEALLLPLAALHVTGGVPALILLRAGLLSWWLGLPPAQAGLLLLTVVFLLTRRCQLQRWLQLEGILAAALVLLPGGRPELAWTLLATGLPLLAVCWGRAYLTRPGLLVAFGWAGAAAVQVFLQSPQPAWTGALLMAWWCALPRVRYLAPGSRTPVAAALLLESLPPLLLARLPRLSWIPWSQGQVRATPESLRSTRREFEATLLRETVVCGLNRANRSVDAVVDRWLVERLSDLAIVCMSVPAEQCSRWLRTRDPDARLAQEVAHLATRLSEPRRRVALRDFAVELGTKVPPTTLEEALAMDPEMLATALEKHFRLPALPKPSSPRFKQVGRVSLGLLLVSPVGLGLSQLFAGGHPQQRLVQAALDQALGQGQARVHLVVRGGERYCTVVHSSREAAGLEASVANLIGVTPGLVRHDLEPRPDWVSSLGLLAAAGLWLLWWRLEQRRQAAARPQPAVNPVADENCCTKRIERKRPEPTEFQWDALTVEVGRGLLAMVDPNQGARLLESVTDLRRAIGEETGVVIPGVRFRDNGRLPRPAFLIRVRGVEVARGEVEVNRFLVRGGPLEGLWVDSEQATQAQTLGCETVDPVSFVAEVLGRVVREAMPELLGVQQTQTLLDQVAGQHPALVAATVPGRITLVALSQVLRVILAGGGGLRDTAAILEYLVNHPEENDPRRLAQSMLAELPSLVRHQG